MRKRNVDEIKFTALLKVLQSRCSIKMQSTVQLRPNQTDNGIKKITRSNLSVAMIAVQDLHSHCHGQPTNNSNVPPREKVCEEEVDGGFVSGFRSSPD